MENGSRSENSALADGGFLLDLLRIVPFVRLDEVGVRNCLRGGYFVAERDLKAPSVLYILACRVSSFKGNFCTQGLETGIAHLPFACCFL